MSTPLLKKIFEPEKVKDITKALIRIRDYDELEYESEIGILMALNDAKEKQKKVFLIKKKLKIDPINTTFKKIEI